MLKLNLDLQCVNNPGTGIAEYANMLISYLQKKEDLKLHGYFSKLHHSSDESFLDKFSFPITKGRIPISLLNSRKFNHPLPIYYELLCHNKADINLYFTWNIKRVLYHGLTIATIHDLIALRTEMESQKIVDDQINDLTYTLKHCNYIITVSEASKEDIIKEFNYPEDRIKVIYNAIDFERFNKPLNQGREKRIRQKYNLPDRFILYLGGMRKHKNLERLIKAYSLLPDTLKESYQLVITRGTESLRDLVESLGIKDKVIFTPFIDDEDKAGLYQLASLYSYVSLYEGFGIPIIEAQAAGTPVITSNVSSIPEVAGDTAMCVDPTSEEAIANGMAKILEDKDYRDNLIQKGFNNAKRFSVESAGKSLYEFLLSLRQK